MSLYCNAYFLSFGKLILPSRYIRAEHYLYEFTKIGSKEAKSGQWWTRKRIGEYFPVIDLQSVAAYLKENGWEVPKIEND